MLPRGPTAGCACNPPSIVFLECSHSMASPGGCPLTTQHWVNLSQSNEKSPGGAAGASLGLSGMVKRDSSVGVEEGLTTSPVTGPRAEYGFLSMACSKFSREVRLKWTSRRLARPDGMRDLIKGASL